MVTLVPEMYNACKAQSGNHDRTRRPLFGSCIIVGHFFLTDAEQADTIFIDNRNLVAMVSEFSNVVGGASATQKNLQKSQNLVRYCLQCVSA